MSDRSMGKPGSIEPLNLENYESQKLNQRVQQGLKIDRSAQNSLDQFFLNMFNLKNNKDLNAFSEMNREMIFRTNRSVNNKFVREINEKIVDSPLVHDQLVELAKPVMLDLLMSVKPTKKNLKQIPITSNSQNESSKKSFPHDKSVRRSFAYFPNVLGESPGIRIRYRNPDGTFEEFPKIPNRDDQTEDDHTQKNIFTNYSLEQIRGSFNTQNYLDPNYLIRLKKFWKSMLRLLEEILATHGPLRKDMDWFVYHVINNDIGLHVLFDNLSMECESRWVKRLNVENEFQMAGIPFFADNPTWFDPINVRKALCELATFSKEFGETEMPLAFSQYRISERTMKKRMYEIAYDVAEGYHRAGKLEQSTLIMDEIDKIF